MRKKQNHKTALVTGGAGYIGSALTPLLLEAGWRVIAYDRFFFGKKPLHDVKDHPGLTLVKGDVRNTRRLAPLVAQADAVVHLASLSNDPSCDLDPQWSKEINHEATVRLADAAIKAGCARFAFASSCSVYGHGSDRLLTESSPCNPVSLYAQLKLKSEQELLKRTGADFCPVILRQATIFGLAPRMRFDLAINQMTLHAITRNKIFVLGGGKQWRPFLHVRDSALVFKAAIEADAKDVSARIFNVGSNENNFQIVDLAYRVQKEIGNVEVEVTPEDADRRDYNVDFSRIRAELGFRPKTDISRGIREVADFVSRDRERDYNTDEFFNIKRMMEHAKTPAANGGEPVRAAKLTVAESLRPLPQTAPARRKKNGVYDFVRAGEGFDLLLRAGALTHGGEAFVGEACDGWLAERLKKYRLKLRIADTLPHALGIDPVTVSRQTGKKVKAVFYSEFDSTTALKAGGRALKVVVTAIAPPTSILRQADAIFWKSDVAPGVAASPAARLIVRNKSLQKRLDVLLRQRTDEWLESPLAGDAISTGFDGLDEVYRNLGEKVQRIKRAVTEAGNAAQPMAGPDSAVGILFDTDAKARKFKSSAEAENIECTHLPGGWGIVKPSGKKGSVLYRRSLFLPVGPATSDGDVSDIIRALQKLL